MNWIKNATPKKFDLLTKFLCLILPLMLISLSVLTIIGVYSINVSTKTALEETMTQTVDIAAGRVADYIESKKTLATSISGRIGSLYADEITCPYDKARATMFEKTIIEMNDAYGFLHMFVVDKDGFARTELRTDIASKNLPLYKAIAEDKQESYMTDPELDSNLFKGAYIISFGVPINNNAGEYIGVLVCKIRASLISDLVSQIMIGDNGSTFIMDNNEKCIAHKNADMLYGGKTFTQVQNNPDYADLNNLWKNMKDNKSGYMLYDFRGLRFAAYTGIKGTNDWCLAVTASQEEFMNQADKAAGRSVMTAIIIVIICTFLIVLFLKRITGRIGLVTNRLEKLAEGDLTSEIVASESFDEIGRLSQATSKLLLELRQMIEGIENSLSQIAKGNLTSGNDTKLPGDLSEISVAIEGNKEILREMMMSISRTAEEVARGSAQMASGAAGLAQGASEQSSSVEELFATVTELSQRAEQIGGEDQRNEINDDKDEFEEEINQTKSVTQMLKRAMERIGETSGAIRKIAAEIDSISAETGMLALNASVEATHAGEYGRGFAVIASEVRSLSDKTRESAKNADEKIDGINKAVERGNQTVEYTIISVGEMTLAIDQIKGALEQISNVVENIAATAEETAASSEELSAQADMLKEMVATFNFEQDAAEDENGEGENV